MNRPHIWDGTTLAVLDTETTQDPAGGYRIVDISIVTVSEGHASGRWTTLVNPTIPIDPASTDIHNITNSAVVDAPTFAEIADTVVERLTPATSADTLIVVAHNARFDIPIIRHELENAGHTIPYIPVLDTTGSIVTLAGLTPTSRNLRHLCELLDIPYLPHHTAQADALALTEASIELLDRAGDNGHTISDIIDQCTDAALSNRYETQIRHIAPMRHITKQHQTDHNNFDATNTKAANKLLIDCGKARCHLTSDTTNTIATSNLKQLVPTAAAAIEHHVTRNDTAAVATIIDAAANTLIRHIVDTTTVTRRAAIKNSYRLWAEALTDLTSPRCPPKTPNKKTRRCTECAADDPCPLDTWIDQLAATAVGTDDRSLASFYDPQPTFAKSSTYTRWTNTGLVQLAQAGAAHLITQYEHTGEHITADRIASKLFQPNQPTHPTIVTRYTQATARTRTLEALEKAHTTATETLKRRRRNNSGPWRQLQHAAATYATHINQLSDNYNTGWRARAPGPHKRRHPKRFTVN